MAWLANSPEAVPDEQWDDWQSRLAETDAWADIRVTRDFVPFNQM